MLPDVALVAFGKVEGKIEGKDLLELRKGPRDKPLFVGGGVKFREKAVQACVYLCLFSPKVPGKGPSCGKRQSPPAQTRKRKHSGFHGPMPHVLPAASLSPTRRT